MSGILAVSGRFPTANVGTTLSLLLEATRATSLWVQHQRLELVGIVWIGSHRKGRHSRQGELPTGTDNKRS